MSYAPLDKLIAEFHAAGRPRVWSLVITVFGDAVQPRGGRISAARLQAVMGRLGIEAGALRTALSRLVKEQWLVRERQGRASFYRLSASGETAFGLATDRIFSPNKKAQAGQAVLGVLIGGTGEARARLDREVGKNQGRVLATGAYVWADVDLPDGEWLAARKILTAKCAFGPVPRAVFDLPTLRAQRRDYEDMLEKFRQPAVGETNALAPLDAFALRTLLVHYWRRIVLRYPELPFEMAPADWPGADCLDLVVALYSAVLGSSETWLDAAAGLEGLPSPGPDLFKRFGGLDQSSR